MAAGRYIVLEGGDGCGKDTQLPLIQQLMQRRGTPVEIVREPYDSPTYGTLIADMLNEANEQPSFMGLPWQEQARLMNAARSEIMEQIREHIARGTYVLASRNWFFTMAYQGHEKGISTASLDWLRAKCEEAVAGTYPDLLLLIDLPAAEALGRQAGKDKDVHERQGTPFHEAVRVGFLLELVEVMANQTFPARIVTASGLSKEDMTRKLWRYIEPL